jgi:acetyltransferase
MARARLRKPAELLVGPNCLGVLAPGSRLNASFAASMPMAGELALISQSGAIAAGMVDWAAQRHVGFSAIASIGDQLDVDFGDLLDYFALDRATRAILLYIESIKDARKFMSAARAAARVKPVVVVKAGRCRASRCCGVRMRQCWKRGAARAPTAVSPARSRTKLARDIIR